MLLGYGLLRGLTQPTLAEARYFGVGGQISAETGFDGRVRKSNDSKSDTKGFAESSLNIGYKPGTGAALGIKWDAIRFQWKR